MEKIYARPEAIHKSISGYCPGCMHSTITKITAQVIDELQIREKTVCILPVGCSTLGAPYWTLDMVAASPGRPPAPLRGRRVPAPTGTGAVARFDLAQSRT